MFLRVHIAAKVFTLLSKEFPHGDNKDVYFRVLHFIKKCVHDV